MAEECMTQPVITVPGDAALDDVLLTMERHQIRRVPVVDDKGRCCGIIAQADVALALRPGEVGNLVREVSRSTGQASHWHLATTLHRITAQRKGVNHA